MKSAGQAEQMCLCAAWCSRQKCSKTAHVLTQQVCRGVSTSILPHGCSPGSAGRTAVCSSFLSFLVTLCSHASEHLPLQTCLQPLIKIMEICSHASANEWFIHSFIHAHPQLSLTEACISLQLLEEVSGYCLHVQGRMTIPPCKESS